MLKKFFELCPGDLFNFEYDYPDRYALCLASYKNAANVCTCVYLHYTEAAPGVITLSLNPFFTVKIHHR